MRFTRQQARGARERIAAETTAAIAAEAAAAAGDGGGSVGANKWALRGLRDTTLSPSAEMPRSKEGDGARKREERPVTSPVAAQQKRTVQGAVFPAQVAAQQKRSVQGEVFPTSDANRKRFKREEERAESAHIILRSKEDDAARKRGGRSVTAQVAAQQKRTLQGTVFPTSDADTNFCPGILQGWAQ